MKISRLLSEKELTFSCEIFPPKPGGNFAQMEKVVRDITALNPDFISVTYGAGGGTSQNTVKIAQYVQSLGVTALAHLSCVSSTREEIRTITGELVERGIENVLALRGDIPEGMERPDEAQYHYANELVTELHAHGGFCIGAACYPEGHVEAASQEQDMEHLKLKVDSGCDFLTTQMFFDNSVLYRFLYRILAKNIRVPVLAGIMPVTNKKQIARIVRLSGTSLPPRFLSILDKFGDHPAAMEQAGIAYATEQIIDLVANGVRGIHLYTMNRPDIAAQIVANLSHILR